MKLQNIQLRGWRQFREIEIEFDPKVTILVGKNGSGKSTVLNLIASRFGWDVPFVKTTETRSPNGAIVYSSGIHNPAEDRKLSHEQIGSMELSGTPPFVVPLCINKNEGPTTTVTQSGIGAHQQLKGVHIPAYRSASRYAHISGIATKAPTPEAAFRNYSQATRNGYINALNHLKQDLVTLSLYGPGNMAVASDGEALALYDGFSGILQQLLPKELNFKKLEVRFGDVLFITGAGAVNLEALSDGIQSIVNLAWQIHLMSGLADSFVVTVDEPEAHLHPEMQFTLLPNLLVAFPNAQFIVATHSERIMSSVGEAHVYGLTFEGDGFVRSHRVSRDTAASSDPTIRELLHLDRMATATK